MMQLSRGGADAVIMREFDLDKKAFVSDEGALLLVINNMLFIYYIYTIIYVYI